MDVPGHSKHKQKHKKKHRSKSKKAGSTISKAARDEAKRMAKLAKSATNGAGTDHDKVTEAGDPKRRRTDSTASSTSTSDEKIFRPKRYDIVEGGGDVSADFMSKESSEERARAALTWMIAPIAPEKFYSDYFESKALLVRHNSASYYRMLFSTNDLDRILHENDVYFGTNIDVTSYVDGKRETHNPEGRAAPAQVWSMYNDGCSIRLLNPQTYVKSVHTLCYTLSEEFASFVGANVYLTPAGTQGFAPHWDDIDAFVLQLEGRKRWKVYAPRCWEEELPLDSSKNLERHEVGKPILETTLETGDLLYMPRGFIHEAQSCPDTYSLHITVSANQHNTYSDLLRLMLPVALERATEENMQFRRTLPRHYLSTMGVMNSDRWSPGRAGIMNMISILFDKLAESAPFDAAFDQMAKSYIHSSLPPVLPPEEQQMSANHATSWADNGATTWTELTDEAEVRLLSKTVCRIVTEGDKVNMYYITDNTKVYREYEKPFCLEITPLEAAAVERLLKVYPDFVKVKDLPYEGTVEDKVELAIMLYQKGLLLAK